MAKYYTPEIIEFHEGFEYEYKYLNQRWEKEVFEIYSGAIDEGSGDYYDFHPQCPATECRVKYLDKKDIENLEWSYVPGNSVGNGNIRRFNLFDGFEGWHLAYWYYIGKDFNDTESAAWNYKLVIKFYGKVRFYGTIKNKSELYKIMNQLEIIKTKLKP